jgi:tetratricopeptide (TPR) repeat protein
MWYRRALDGWLEGDQLNRGKTLGELGFVAYERYKDAWQAGQPEVRQLEHLNAALQAYQEALAMLPADKVDTRAAFHHQPGNIYGQGLPDYLDQAVAHYRESIRYREQAGNIYGAGQTRENVAIIYAEAGRFEDALLFARAALRNFEQFGPAAADRVARAQELIGQIEQAARGGRGG